MELKDWLPIIFERSNATSTLWNLQIAYLVAIIAVVATYRELARSVFIRMSLTVVFTTMACVNLSALISVAQQRLILYRFLRTLDKNNTLPDLLTDVASWPFLPYPLQVAPIWLILILHLLIDSFVLAFIWFYPSYAAEIRKEASNDSSTLLPQASSGSISHQETD